MRTAVFFDRDGVIIHAVELGDGVTRAPLYFGEFKFVDGSKETLELVRETGFLRVLASNQPDVAYGNLPEDVWQAMQKRVEILGFDAVYVCRHARAEGCACKKPKPGMLREAAAKQNIDVNKSFMVGDTQSDVDAAHAAGCKAIVLDWPYNQDVAADYRIKSLLEVLPIIKASR